MGESMILASYAGLLKGSRAGRRGSSFAWAFQVRGEAAADENGAFSRF